VIPYLPHPGAHLIDPGPRHMPGAPGPLWNTIYKGIPRGLPVVEVERRELPPWNAGPYRQDVPVRGR
jgi:hypothetical protein